MGFPTAYWSGKNEAASVFFIELLHPRVTAFGRQGGPCCEVTKGLKAIFSVNGRYKCLIIDFDAIGELLTATPSSTQGTINLYGANTFSKAELTDRNT